MVQKAGWKNLKTTPTDSPSLVLSLCSCWWLRLLMTRYKKWKCVDVHSYKMQEALNNQSVNIIPAVTWVMPGSTQFALYPHARDEICLVVKRRQQEQQTILQSFSGLTWTAIVVSLAAFAGALRLNGRRNVMLDVLDAFINGGFVTRESDRRGNFLFLLLSAFGMVIVSAFTGTFMGFLAVLGEPQQIQTLEEAVSQVTKICGNPTHTRFLHNVDRSDVLWRLFDKFEVCSPEEQLEMAYAEYPTRPKKLGPAFISSVYDQALWFHSPELWNNFADTSFAYKVPECLVTPTFMSFMMQMKDHQKNRLNALLQAIVEGGIYAKIESNVWMKWRYMGYVRRGPALAPAFAVPPAPTSAPRPLGRSALVEPAFVLTVGALTATVAFLVEAAMSVRANGCFEAGARLLCCRSTARN